MCPTKASLCLLLPTFFSSQLHFFNIVWSICNIIIYFQPLMFSKFSMSLSQNFFFCFVLLPYLSRLSVTTFSFFLLSGISNKISLLLRQFLLLIRHFLSPFCPIYYLLGMTTLNFLKIFRPSKLKSTMFTNFTLFETLNYFLTPFY